MCRRCWPSLVPRCGRCRTPATPLEVLDDYIVYPRAFCAECVLAVQSAGHWRERRARAREARIDVLLERYPDLFIELRTWPRVVLVGVLEGRNVWITLRIRAREGEYDRYILKVELKEPREQVEKSALGLPEHVERNLSRAPSVIFDRFRHVRAAFAHLGKLDILYALEAMLAATRALDDAVIAARDASRDH